MGRVVPKSIQGRIAFFNARAQEWLDHAAEIGLTPEQAQRVADLAVEAQQALDLQLALAQSARAATASLNTAVAELMKAGASAIGSIRAFEGSVGGPGVLAAAAIPERRRWSRIGPPPVPERLSLRLQSDGAVAASWSGRFPPGTFFTIERSLDGLRFAMIWTTAGRAKRFRDETLPLGSASASYRVLSHRRGHAGVPSQPVSIRFGVRGELGAMAVAA